MKKSVILSLLMIASPAVVYADSCKDINFSMDASSVRELIVDVGAGDLEIRGDANATEITVVAEACASNRRGLDDLKLLRDTRGSTVEIRSERSRGNSGFFWWSFSGSSHIDVEIVMPAGLALEVDDGSGPLDISGVSDLRVDDGSGSIYISDIEGNVYVDDGSGEIRIRNVSGLVSIEDGSGDLRVTDSDSVHIIDDGSGDIDIESIGGDVHVGDSGSGRLRVNSVAGNYTSDDH